MRINIENIGMWMLFFFIISCEAPGSTSSAKKEVVATFQGYVKDINEKNTASMTQYFSEAPSFFWVEEGRKVYANKTELIENLKGFTSQIEQVSMTIKDQEVVLHGTTYASLFASYSYQAQLSSGPLLQMEGAMTIFLVKEKSGWKFLNGHSSNEN